MRFCQLNDKAREAGLYKKHPKIEDRIILGTCIRHNYYAKYKHTKYPINAVLALVI